MKNKGISLLVNFLLVIYTRLIWVEISFYEWTGTQKNNYCNLIKSCFVFKTNWFIKENIICTVLVTLYFYILEQTYFNSYTLF